MLLQLRRLTNHPGLWLTIVFLGGGFIAYLFSNADLGNAIFLLGAGIGLGWLITWWIARQTITKPLKNLIAAGEALVTKDGHALTDALAALSQGNLTARVKMDSQPLMLNGSDEANQLAGLLNNVMMQLQDSAREFNTVTDEPCQRLFYVGADAYLEGRTCGEMMGQALNGQGQVGVIIGLFSQTSHQLRRKGFESILREKYPHVQILKQSKITIALRTVTI